MKESDWTTKVCEALTQAGAICIANVMGKMSSHVPDRSIICRQGNFFIEFKGARTLVRPGQKILAERINARYPCCFVYRYPDQLTLMNQTVTVDALVDTRGFLTTLQDMSRRALPGG